MIVDTNRVIRSRAPLRLGLAGGGTDVSPFSDEHGGCVLNATIDLYAQAIIRPLDTGEVIFNAADRSERIAFHAGEEIPDEEPLRIHRGVHNRVVNQFLGGNPVSCEVTTYADAPAGSGLGTSSTLVVCILQAYSEWLQLGLGEYDIAKLAYEIERVDLRFAGGKQDQYAAAFGGFNFIEFSTGGSVLVNPLRVRNTTLLELEASTVLYYTGQSRESAKIIQQQIDNAKSKKARSIEAMHELKSDAFSMKEAILRGDLQAYSRILNKSWLAKKSIADGITNASIDEVFDAALNSGADAGKISGAGGGGFMMFYVKPENRMNLIRSLQDFNGQCMNFHFTQDGAQSWTHYR